MYYSAMRYQMSISVFFPALNEEDNIANCIARTQTYLAKRFKNYEIIVVANGSTDDTAKIVKKLWRKNKRLILVDDREKGYGAALKSGFKKARGDLIFYTDSDNQFNIEEMDKLLPMLSDYDVISGYRKNRKDPIPRIFTAYAYNLLIRILFGLDVKDVDASFKLYKKEVIKSMKFKSNTGLIDAEILIKAKKKGFSIGQVGVTHYPRKKGRAFYEIGVGKGSIAIVHPKVVIDILKEIKTLWRELR